LVFLASSPGQNLGDDAADAELTRDRIGGTVVVVGQGHHLMLL